VTGKYLLGAIELLEEHAADEQMRPCHRSERYSRISASEDSGGQPIGAADGEGQLGPSLITPGGDTVGQSPARPSGAVLVEGDKRNAGRQCTEDQFRLAGFQQGRRERAPLVELDDDRWWDDPPRIKCLEFLQRTAAQLANGEKAKPDCRCPDYW
jgi:hypothetical protein